MSWSNSGVRKSRLGLLIKPFTIDLIVAAKVHIILPLASNRKTSFKIHVLIDTLELDLLKIFFSSITYIEFYAFVNFSFYKPEECLYLTTELPVRDDG